MERIAAREPEMDPRRSAHAPVTTPPSAPATGPPSSPTTTPPGARDRVAMRVPADTLAVVLARSVRARASALARTAHDHPRGRAYRQGGPESLPHASSTPATPEIAGGPVLQRVIYKDDKAKAEGGAYQSLRKVQWYLKLKKDHQPIAERLHKSLKIHLTIAEAERKIQELLTSTAAAGDLDDVFPDEVDHARVAPADRILTVEDFAGLPASGTINPYRLRTAQGGIELHFREAKYGKISDLVHKLAEEPAFARKLTAVEIGVHEGRVWSFDTRRVVAHQQARARNPSVVINFKKISTKALAERIGSIYTPRRWAGLVTSVRNEGLKSGSQAHVNPAYADQLDDVVALSWLYDSPVGFPDRPVPAVEEDAEQEEHVVTV